MILNKGISYDLTISYIIPFVIPKSHTLTSLHIRIAQLRYKIKKNITYNILH